jgi:ribosomal protein S18 acetylase RimI-like enzyme
MRRQGLLVLVFDGAVAGYAMLGRSRSAANARAGEIYELYLRPPYQGVGLGRHLFKEAQRTLADFGFRGLIVWALADNAAACAFYRRMGGRPAAEHVEHLGGANLVKIGFVWPA